MAAGVLGGGAVVVVVGGESARFALLEPGSNLRASTAERTATITAPTSNSDSRNRRDVAGKLARPAHPQRSIGAVAEALTEGVVELVDALAPQPRRFVAVRVGEPDAAEEERGQGPCAPGEEPARRLLDEGDRDAPNDRDQDGVSDEQQPDDEQGGG